MLKVLNRVAFNKGRSKRNFSIILSFFLMVDIPAFACTTFHVESSNSAITAKNYDYDIQTGVAFVNTRGRAKSAIISNPLQMSKALHWVSRYGSVTFTQNIQEIAISGMNEKGLVTEYLVLYETKYPRPDQAHRIISEAQLSQYLLDNAANVPEALSLIDNLGIIRMGIDIHMFMCDANKECAVVEFLDGKLKVHQGNELKHKALTNTIYSDAVNQIDSARVHDLRNYTLLNDTQRSLARFSIAAQASNGFKSDMNPIEYAFSKLDSASVDNPSEDPHGRLERTQWSLVYDQTNKLIYFKTKLSTNLKLIDFSKINFEECSEEVLFLNMNITNVSDATSSFTKIGLWDRYQLLNSFSPVTTFQKIVMPLVSSKTVCK